MKPHVVLHRLIRRLQQRNRVVGRSEVTGLTLTDIHVLVELDSTPGRGISELAEHLRVGQSFSSRIVQSLVKKKLVSVRTDRDNARRKQLTLTATGHKVVAKLDETANMSYRAMASHVSPSDEARVVWLLRTLADGFDQHALRVRPSESAYRVEQRRITRCCRLLGENVFGSSLSPSVWQVLGEVVLAPVAPQPGELAVLLSLAQNSLSSLVSSMEKRKLITREPCPWDARSVRLKPLPPGEEAYREVEHLAAKHIQRALKDVPAKEVHLAVEAFGRFVDDPGIGLPPLPAWASLVRSTSVEQRQLARGFIACCLVRDGFQQSIPEHFVSEINECVLLYRDGIPVAALEIDAARGVVVCCGWHESVSPWVLSSFIGAVILQHTAKPLSFANLCESFMPLHAYLDMRQIARDLAS